MSEPRCDANVTRRDVLTLGGLALAGGLASAGELAAPAPPAAQTPKRGGVFRFPGFDPPNFDPHQSTPLVDVHLHLPHPRRARPAQGRAQRHARDLAHRGRPRGVRGAAERDDLCLQAQQGRPVAQQAAGERARADGRGRGLHVRAGDDGHRQSAPRHLRGDRQGGGGGPLHRALHDEGALRLVPGHGRARLHPSQGSGGQGRHVQEAGDGHRHRPVDARALRAQRAAVLRAPPGLFSPGPAVRRRDRGPHRHGPGLQARGLALAGSTTSRPRST